MENLKEERYYYGEIENIKDSFEEIQNYLNDIEIKVSKKIKEANENNYNETQLNTLKEVNIDIDSMLGIIKNLKDKLLKDFPNRIRTLTPEEKQYIEKTKKEESEDTINNESNIEIVNDTLNDKISDIQDEEEIESNTSEKTVLDYLNERIGEEFTIGEFNTALQNILAQYNTIFITLNDFYNQDPSEIQQLVIWDNEDMYIINYEIIDQDDQIVKIISVNEE